MATRTTELATARLARAENANTAPPWTVFSDLANAPIARMDQAHVTSTRTWRLVLENESQLVGKLYGREAAAPRDPIGRAFLGLSFLRENGLGHLVPQPIAGDCDHGAALYSWMPGDRIDAHDPSARGPDDTCQLLEFLEHLHGLARDANTGSLPSAYGARFSVLSLFAELERRAAWLRGALRTDTRWNAFLEDRLAPILEAALKSARRKCARIGIPFTSPLPTWQCTLSSVDFGFHRALRRHDGTLVFLGFEGFGWDDPVRLTADMLWNTEMTLGPWERNQLAAGLGLIYGDDPGFIERLPVLFPLHGLRWVMRIVERDVQESRSRDHAERMLEAVEIALAGKALSKHKFSQSDPCTQGGIVLH